MKFKHEDLDVWRLAVGLTIKINPLANKFPKEEIFGLTSQIKRSSVSVALNIAEGSGRYSKKDFAKFVRISIGSLLETGAALKIAIQLGYITQNDYDNLSDTIQELYFKLIGLDKSLVNRNEKQYYNYNR